MSDATTMSRLFTVIRVALLAFPALVLLGYGWFIVTTYRPFLDWHLRLRSPDLAALPEDVIGLGFWMWWPLAALLFVMTLAGALTSVQRQMRVATTFLAVFAMVSAADYLLCERLVHELNSY